jgi:hypothetical protein
MHSDAFRFVSSNTLKLNLTQTRSLAPRKVDAGELARLVPGADLTLFLPRLASGPVYGFDVVLGGGGSLPDTSGLTALVVSDPASAAKVRRCSSHFNRQKIRMF